MTVEDVIKVSKMAQEFLDQGISSTREEAVKKAQEILEKDIVEIEPVKEAEQITTSDDSLDKIKNIVDRTKEHVDRQFANHKQALIALEQEINKLRKEISDVRAMKEKVTAQHIEAENNEGKSLQGSSEAGTVKDAVEPQQQELKENKKETHPRGGDVDKEAVSIEKMFYFGNK